MNGAEPSRWTLKLTVGGPWDSLKAILGLPVGCWMTAVAKYSSKFSLKPFVQRSSVLTAKPPRKTQFCRKLYAMPTRGWKLLRSRPASAPVGCSKAPFSPVNGSIAAGSNRLCCPYLVWYGLSVCQRTPRFSVSLFVTFQSSWKYSALLHHRGSQVPSALVKSARATPPNRNEANTFPVLGVNGNSVPPNR